MGLASQLEVEYDEYTADTPRNRVLATAVRKALRVPGLRTPTFAELRRSATMLELVPSLSPRDALPSRTRNDRPSAYDEAVRLAFVVLDDKSIELADGKRDERLPTAAFIIDMWRVFEDFVSVALCQLAQGRPVTTWLNRSRALDTDGQVTCRPDVLWLSSGVPTAVADVKYKIETKSGHINEDVYQMVAYCASLGLDRGHLVYAKGNATSAVIHVGQIAVEVHALDLEAQPSDLKAQVHALSARILGHA